MTKEQAIELAIKSAKESGEFKHVLVFAGDYSVASNPKQGSIFAKVARVTPRGTTVVAA